MLANITLPKHLPLTTPLQTTAADRLVSALHQRNIQAILWDLDGTLVDSEGSFQAQAFTRAMQIVHDLTPPVNELGIPHTVGKTPDEIFNDLCEKTGIPAETCDNKQLMATRQSLLKHIIGDGVKLMPGVLELLSILHQNGFKLAVASQSPQWQAELVVQSAGIASFFDLILGGDRVPSDRRKPEPDLYEMAAWQLGVPTPQCLALEDTMIGATAGTRAGCHTILIPTPYNQHESNPLGPTLYGTLANVEGLIRILERPINEPQPPLIYNNA